MDDQQHTAIETKLTYQEDLIQELNKIVHSQQQKLSELEDALISLTLRYNSLAEQTGSGYSTEEKPPHY